MQEITQDKKEELGLKKGQEFPSEANLLWAICTRSESHSTENFASRTQFFIKNYLWQTRALTILIPDELERWSIAAANKINPFDDHGQLKAEPLARITKLAQEAGKAWLESNRQSLDLLKNEFEKTGKTFKIIHWSEYLTNPVVKETILSTTQEANRKDNPLRGAIKKLVKNRRDEAIRQGDNSLASNLDTLNHYRRSCFIHYATEETGFFSFLMQKKNTPFDAFMYAGTLNQPMALVYSQLLEKLGAKNVLVMLNLISHAKRLSWRDKDRVMDQTSDSQHSAGTPSSSPEHSEEENSSTPPRESVLSSTITLKVTSESYELTGKDCSPEKFLEYVRRLVPVLGATQMAPQIAPPKGENQAPFFSSGAKRLPPQPISPPKNTSPRNTQ